MTEQAILEAVQEIFRDNFDDDTLEITRATCADDIEDWDSLEQINLRLAHEARKVLDVNKSERHIRGGLATKEKYAHMER